MPGKTVKKSLLDILAGFSDGELKSLFEEAQRHRTAGKFRALTFDVPDESGESEDEGDEEPRRGGGFFGGR